MMQEDVEASFRGYTAQVLFPKDPQLSPQWLCSICRETFGFAQEEDFRRHFDALHAKSTIRAEISINISLVEDCGVDQILCNSFNFEWHPSVDDFNEVVATELGDGAIEQSLDILVEANEAELERNLKDFLLQEDDVVIEDLNHVAPKLHTTKKRWFKKNPCCLCGKKGFRSHGSFHLHMRKHAPVACEYCPAENIQVSAVGESDATEISLNDISQLTPIEDQEEEEGKEKEEEEEEETRDEQKEIQCQECGRQSIANHRAYHVHLRGHAHRSGRHIKCVYCDKVLSAKGAWSKAVSPAGDTCSSFECCECLEVHTSHTEHHRHIKTHIDINHSIQCEYCQKKMRKNAFKDGSGDKPLYQCLHCDWKTHGLHYNYHRHQIKHLPWADSTFQCEHCKKTFTKHELQEYFKKKYTDKPRFKCAQCVYVTHIHAHYHQHLVCHIQYDQSACSICNHCGVDARKSSDVASSGDVSYLECTLCPYGPVQEGDLKRHQQMKHGIDQGIDEFSCDECVYKTHDKASAKRHQSAHERKDLSKNEYCCGECNFSCTRESVLKCHLEIHNGDKPLLKCQVCDYVNESQKGLLCHMRQTHNLFPKVCAECGAIFTSIDELEVHLSGEHEIRDCSLLCPHCGKLSRDEAKHLKHIASHITKPAEEKAEAKDAEILKCDLCDFVTKGPLTLRRHVLCHADSFYQCHQCSEVCDTAQALDSHKEVNHPVHESDVQCHPCDKVFKSAAQLLWHNSKQHKSRATYKCNQCSFTSLRIGNMKRHKAKHSKAVHQCNMCDYSSTSERFMASHYQKSHLVEAPPEFVSPSTTKNDKRKGCIRRSQKVVCDLCGLLINKATIKNHKKRHLGVRPLKCQYDDCDYSCVTSSELSSHIKRRHLGMKIVSRKTQHVCYVCGYSTCEKYRLMQHLQRTHHVTAADNSSEEKDLSLLLDQNNFDSLQIDMPLRQMLQGGDDDEAVAGASALLDDASSVVKVQEVSDDAVLHWATEATADSVLQNDSYEAYLA